MLHNIVGQHSLSSGADQLQISKLNVFGKDFGHRYIIVLAYLQNMPCTSMIIINL